MFKKQVVLLKVYNKVKLFTKEVSIRLLSSNLVFHHWITIMVMLKIKISWTLTCFSANTDVVLGCEIFGNLAPLVCQNERSWPKSLLIILYFFFGQLLSASLVTIWVKKKNWVRFLAKVNALVFFGQLLSFWQNERSQRPKISHLKECPIFNFQF